MGRFATRARRLAAAGPGAWEEQPTEDTPGLPAWFEAAGEAQASGTPAAPACTEAGRRLAAQGVPLAEALRALEHTSWARAGRAPDFEETRAVCLAWSEETLGFLHRLSCADPVTGLATQPHLRARLEELYRAGGDVVRRGHALVVVEAPQAGGPLPRLALARLGRGVHAVFGPATTAALGSRRVGVLVARDEGLGRRVALLRRILGDVPADRVRVWIEGLPGSDESAARLLDELTRT